MKLTRFRVRNYKSILDSGWVRISDITCLVGKNESGKTSLLQALNALNPIRDQDSTFSVTDDYPRTLVGDYQADIEADARKHDVVIEAIFGLDESEIAAVSEQFGPLALRETECTLTKNYANEKFFYLNFDELEAIRHLTQALPPPIKLRAERAASARDLLAVIKDYLEDPEVRRILTLAAEAAPTSFSQYAFNRHIAPNTPKFMYFDEFYQLTGLENLEALKARRDGGELKPSDYPLIGLLELARLDLDKISRQNRTQELKNRLEAAGVYLSKSLLPFWSQNRHLQMRFDVRPAMPEDPPEMRHGANIWSEVYDTRRFASTALGARSRGFVWFFSFVAWYSKIQREYANVIILLDEPGQTLHGRAQADLLRYFEQQLKKDHQLLYTTHSPYMVDARHLERVRIVQDLSTEVDDPPPGAEGTKVLEDIFEATQDSLLPLKGALAQESQQNGLVGPANLLVESPTDVLILEAMSRTLERERRIGLDERWTLTPVGGASRLPLFVRLSAERGVTTIAALHDLKGADPDAMERLHRSRALAKSHVRAYADYTGGGEADVEDLFEPAVYLELVNAEYGRLWGAPLREHQLSSRAARIRERLDGYFSSAPMKANPIDRGRLARRLFDDLDSFAPRLSPQSKARFEAAFRDLNSLLPAR